MAVEVCWSKLTLKNTELTKRAISCAFGEVGGSISLDKESN